MTSRAALALVLALALMGLSLGTELRPTGPLWFWVFSLAMDVGSPPVGALGFLPLGFPWWMAVAQNGTASGAALVLGLGLLLRTLRGSRPELELTADLLPGAAALAAYGYLPPVGGVVPSAVYFLAWLAMPALLSPGLERSERKRWRQARYDLAPAALALAGLAPMVAHLASLPAGLAVAGLTVPCFMRAARLSRDHQAVMDLDTKQRSLAKLRQELSDDNQSLTRSRRELEFKLETYSLVDRLLHGLTEEPALSRVVQGILKMVHSRLECQTVVMFWKEGQDLVPLGWITPYPERLDRAALVGTQEKIVERAAQSMRLTPLTAKGNSEARIFPEEEVAVAVPMRNRGALYVGRLSGNWAPEQLEFLQIVSSNSLVAVESALFHQASQQALGRETRSREALELLVGRLTSVLDSSFEMMRLHRHDQLLEQTGAGLEQLIPHDVRLVRAGNLETSKGSLDLTAARALLEVVRQNARPLLVERFDTTRFAPPAPGIQSALTVPIPSEAGIVGGILLGSLEPGRFRRDDQELLTLLASQLGSMFMAVRLYTELEQAHGDLQQSQAQLIQSSKMAAIGQLAGGVAHELNSPLGAITLFVGGALQVLEKRPERARERLEMVLTSAEQMKEIISKLLFYSRESPKVHRRTDLNQVIQDTMQVIGNQLRLDDIIVVTQLCAEALVNANPNELQQVLTNLVLNGRDAVMGRDPASRWIVVETTADQEEVVLLVSDSGLGISEEAKQRVFEPFFTTKEPGQGTGLGLSISLQLVHQHGGRLEVDCQEGCGSRFRVHLPSFKEETV